MKGGGKNFPTKRKSRSAAAQDELAAALELAKAAQAEAAIARAEAERATDEATRARAEAVRERIRAKKAHADTRVPGTSLGAFGRPLDIGMRKRLVTTLCMLGSDRAGERASAALIADKERAQLGMTWDELIVRETDDVDHLDGDDRNFVGDDIEDDLDDAYLDDGDEDDCDLIGDINVDLDDDDVICSVVDDGDDDEEPIA